MNTLLKHKIANSIINFRFNGTVQLDRLPLEEQAELNENSKIISLPRKSVLYTQGEIPKGIYILLKGKIKISQLNADGSVHIIFIYIPGDTFGHRVILSDEKHPVSATALENCEILLIEKDQFLKVLRQSPRLSEILLKSIGHEFSLLLNRINLFAQRGIKERLALFLLILNEQFKIPGQVNDESEIIVSRKDLASYAGTAVENLVRMLKDFKDKNYIRTSGKAIYINDFEALYALTRL